MPNLLEMFKSLRDRPSSELSSSRDRQTFSIAAKRAPLSDRLPSEDEFTQLLNKEYFGTSKVTAENLREMFFEISRETFFPSFREKQPTMEFFRRNFKGKSITRLLGRSEAIIEGKFDFPGFGSLDFGTPIDWRFNPLSGRQLSLKDRNRFDELDPVEASDQSVVWELNRHQHFFTLGATFALTEEERYAAAFAKHLEGWMQQNPPGTGVNWLSSREIALRSIAWLWAFNFFKDSESLTPEIFLKALKFLQLNAYKLEEYLSADDNAKTNRVCQALGLYYLGTQLELFERSAHWRALSEEVLFTELDRQVPQNGGSFEQLRRSQRQTAECYTQFLILRALNESHFEGRRHENLKTKIQLLHDFLLYVVRPDGTSPFIEDRLSERLICLSDAGPGDFRALLSTAAVLFERRDYKFVAGHLREETLWLLGAEGAKKFENLPASRPLISANAFSPSGYYAMRDGWAKTDNYLLIDGGKMSAPEKERGNEPRLGIVSALGGKALLTDPEGSFESAEMSEISSLAGARNTLVIEEKSDAGPDKNLSGKSKANAKVDWWITEARFDFFSGERGDFEHLSQAATHRRSILFLKNDYWIMRDFVDTQGEHEYALNFNFSPKTKPQLKKLHNDLPFVGETPLDKTGWRMVTFGDNGKWEIQEKTSVAKVGQRSPAPFLRFVSHGAGAQEFFTFFLPLPDNLDKPKISDATVAGGRIFVIDYHSYRDLFVFTDGGQILRTEIFNTNFQFHWARMSPGEQQPEEFVMINGSNFSLGKREVINDPNNLKFATARRFGNRLNVRTNESIFSVSLPKKQSTTFILKNILDI